MPRYTCSNFIVVLGFLTLASSHGWCQAAGAVQNPSPFVTGLSTIYHVDNVFGGFTKTCDLIGSLVVPSGVTTPPVIIYSDVHEDFTCDPFNQPTSISGTGGPCDADSDSESPTISIYDHDGF